jgi:hypothetical protein
MGKDWYRPQRSIERTNVRKSMHGEKMNVREGTGIRSLRSMRLDGLSSTKDLYQLNLYLGEMRNAIYNWQINGDRIVTNTVSSAQIARQSVAGSCLDDPFEFTGTLWVRGSISADRYISAASGFYTDGDYYGVNLSATGNVSADNIIATGWISGAGNVSAASGVFVDGVRAAYLSSLGVIRSINYIQGARFEDVGNTAFYLDPANTTLSLITNGPLSSNSDVSAASGVFVSGLNAGYISSTNGVETAASGEFHSGINTSYMSCTGVTEALSVWPQNGWTGSFTVNGGANTCYVSSGIITGVV